MTSQNTAEKVTIVTVSYNSMSVLPQMLASIPSGARTVVVDNASDDTGPLKKLTNKHNAQLIENSVNKGFGVACNQGAELATTDFILFLNPDAELAPDTLDHMVQAMETYKTASAMNPRIENGKGAPSFKRGSHLMPRSEKMPRGWPTQDCELPVLSGAAFFVRRKDFEAVGGFDPEIFLYHEDDDLARRLRNERGPLMFIRDALVRHQEGRSSTRSSEIAALKAWHMGRSRVYTTRKHNQTGAFLRSFLQAGLQLLSPITLLSARKRAKNWGFFRGVISAKNFHPVIIK